jgi:hypothetical protein
MGYHALESDGDNRRQRIADESIPGVLGSTGWKRLEDFLWVTTLDEESAIRDAPEDPTAPASKPFT